MNSGRCAMIPEVRDHMDDIVALCREYGVERLELFGSAAKDAFRPGDSDLDFLVEFEAPQLHGYASRFFGFLAALEDLFGVSVDLVVDSAIDNPYFRRSVDDAKTLLYAA